ncbi:hypothetical protein [Marinobacter nitratireducens]|uniref:hypothetical protein n=1 Tax=Marinobacter nitratireducens TaxID=1137280 RepID=UPI0005615F00|nr:hypothetical protein [Marinobacter nitratireducens]
MLKVLFVSSAIAFIGGALLIFIGLGFFLFRRTQSTKLFANRPEFIALLTSIFLAVAGFTALLVAPVYQGTETRTQVSIEPATGVTFGESTTEKTRKSFVEVNGIEVLPLFIAPVFIALLPMLFFKLGIRPVVEGICALLLGGQAAIGMTGYGTFFGPSGLVMVIAGILALRSNNAT